jgi:hypothetical protein
LIYFVQGAVTKNIKIGWTEGLTQRLKTIQSYCSESVTCLLVLRDSRTITEKGLHERFKSLNIHGEWFRPEQELINEDHFQDLVVRNQEIKAPKIYKRKYIKRTISDSWYRKTIKNPPKPHYCKCGGYRASWQQICDSCYNKRNMVNTLEVKESTK